LPLADGVGTDNALARGAFSVSSTGRFAYRGGAPTQRREFVWVGRTGNLLGKVAPNDDLVTPGNPELSPDGHAVSLFTAEVVVARVRTSGSSKSVAG
jgi:hypothetical protein